MKRTAKKGTIVKKNPYAVKQRDPSTYITGRFVGGHVSLQTAEYLRLKAVVSNCSIQKVLQTIIEDWAQRDAENVDSLTEVLADSAHLEWLRRWNNYPIEKRDEVFYQNTKKEYIEEMKNNLALRKITYPKHLNAILSLLDERIEASHQSE